MASVVKKEVACDYCQTEKEAGLIYSAKKMFAGRKVLDLLQIVSQRSLPINVGIKICNVCTSSLMSTTAIIEKTQQLIEKSLESRKKKTTTTTATQQSKQEEERNYQDSPLEVIDLEEKTAEIELEKKPQSTNKLKDDLPPPKGSPKKAVATPTQKAVATPTKNVAVTTPTKKVAAATPTKKAASATSIATVDIQIPFSPAKTAPAPQKTTPKIVNQTTNEDAEKIPLDAVKVTPSYENVKKKNSLIQLFGPSETINVNVSDSEDEDFSPTAGGADQTTAKKLAIFNSHISTFDCKLCDFVGKTGKILKDHLKSVHNQQRPRIYFCSACPKTFGVLKTLTQHLATHGIIKPEIKKTVEEQPKPKTITATTKQPQTAEPSVAPEPKLAVLTALNEPKPSDNTINPEYTFQINGESTSTPKPIDGRRKSMNFQCDVCDSEVQTVKLMQKHMQKAHKIEKPKIFKCIPCAKQFTTKQNLDIHLDRHHNDPKPNNTKSKTKSPSKSKAATAEAKNAKSNGLTKSLPQNGEELKVKPSKKDPKKLESSPLKKKPEATEKSPAKKAKPKPANIINLDNTEISLLSNDEFDSSLNQTVMKSPFKKMKADPDKVIKNDKETSLNKSVKRKNDNTLDSTTKSKNNSVKSTTIPEDEINYQVKPHKKTRLESFVHSENDESFDVDADEEEAVSCNQCGKSVPSRKRLESHIQKRHAKTLICPTCMSIFSCYMEYVTHFKECDTSDGLACGIRKCNKIFNSDAFLISHLEKKHEWS